MSAAGLARLRSQREPPPYFAGRTKELATLNKRLDDLCEACSTPSTSSPIPPTVQRAFPAWPPRSDWARSPKAKRSMP